MGYQENAKEWLDFKGLDEDLKKELLSLTEEELKEVFYKDLEFGTAGIRGIMGVGTNRLNIYIVKKVALGFANYLKKTLNKSNISVAISYDNRINSKLFAYTQAKVLAKQGIKTHLTKELRPTPYLSYLIRTFNCDGGLMVTASHNPKEYNGIKAYDQDGGQLIPQLTDILVNEVNKIENYFEIEEANNELINLIDESFDESYLNEVFNVQLNKTQKKPYKFVYSPLHGTGGTLINKIIKETGYLIYPEEKQMVFDGNFSDTKSSNPEDKEAFELALKKALAIDAEAILVTDPDADRLAIAIKHEGEYVYLNGNQTISIQLYYLLSQKQNQNILKDGLVIYSNVTSPIIKTIANSFKIEALEVLTGFKFIADAIRNSEKPFLFGAEESYGSLILPFVRDKDAIQAVLNLVEMVTYYKNNNQTLYDVLLEIYQKYGFYGEKTLSFTFSGQEGANKIKAIMDHYRNNGPKYIVDKPLRVTDLLKQTVKEGTTVKKIGQPLADVVKYQYKDYEITFRPSGTEPKLKVYIYVKGNSLEKANNQLTMIVNLISKEIEEI